MPARVSAGDLLLVALKMPPSSTGTYSNFTAVRCSIAGIASWLRKALGLPKSNMNCGDDLVKAASRQLLDHCGKAGGARHTHYDYHNTVARAGRRSNQPLHGASAPDQHVIAHLQNEHGGEGDGIGGPDAFDTDRTAEDHGGGHFHRGDRKDRQRHLSEHRAAGTHNTRDEG